MNAERSETLCDANGCSATLPNKNAAEAPRFDVFEEGERFTVRVYLPGVAGSNVAIELANKSLSVRGTRSAPAEKAQYYRREFGDCDFELRLQVGDRIDAARIEADYREGVLTLGLPKTLESKPRVIPVRQEN